MSSHKYKKYYIDLNNKNYAQRIIRKHADKDWDIHECYYRQFVNNPDLTMQDILNNTTVQWDYQHLSTIPDITLQFVMDNLNKNWNINKVIDTLNITEDDILNKQVLQKFQLKFGTFIYAFSSNPHLTIHFIKNNINENWGWYYISRNPNFTIKDIQDNLDLPWDWNGLSQNPNLTVRFIKNHMYEDWDWYIISQNSNITMRDIQDNLDFPWEWDGVSRNPNVTIKDIKNNPNLPWEWDGVSRNPNLTYRCIKNNLITKNNFHKFLLNKFLFDDTVFKKEQTKFKKHINKLLINKTNLCYQMIDEINEFL